MRTVETDYKEPIRVGTREDDGRFSPSYLFIQTGDSSTRRGLSKVQALALVAALVETVQGLE